MVNPTLRHEELFTGKFPLAFMSDTSKITDFLQVSQNVLQKKGILFAFGKLKNILIEKTKEQTKSCLFPKNKEPQVLLLLIPDQLKYS